MEEGEEVIGSISPMTSATSRSIVFHHNPNHPKRARRRANGSLIPVGFLINRPEPCQLVDLFGQGHGHGHRRGWHVIGRAQRRVMFLRLRRRCASCPRLRVVAPHQPLKFGEFIDHFGRQIGLGQTRGLLAIVGSAPDRGRNSRASGHAVINSAWVPSLLWKVTFSALEPVCHARLGDAQSRFPRRTLHPPNARTAPFGCPPESWRPDLRCRGWRRYKAFDPPVFGLRTEKNFLVLFHRGLQNLGRQAKEVIRDLAHQHHRPFDQALRLRPKALRLRPLQARGKGLLVASCQIVVGPFSARQAPHKRAFSLAS